MEDLVGRITDAGGNAAIFETDFVEKMEEQMGLDDLATEWEAVRRTMCTSRGTA